MARAVHFSSLAHHACGNLVAKPDDGSSLTVGKPLSFNNADVQRLKSSKDPTYANLFASRLSVY